MRPLRRPLGRGPHACLDRRRVGRQLRAGARPPGAWRRARRLQHGRAEKDLHIGRDAQRVRQLRAMERPPKYGVVAELGIGDDGGHGQTTRAHLLQQRHGQAPLFLEPNGGRNPGALALRRCQPLFGQIQARANHPRAHTRPERRRHGHLTIRRLPQRAAVLTRHADRVRALLGKAGAVENQHAGTIGDHGPQPAPHRGDRPRRVGDEMLKRLIRAGVADARQHRAHRLPAAVAQQAEEIPTEGTALRDMAEARFERLEPRAQPIQPRRRIARQHCPAAYRNGHRMTNTNSGSNPSATEIDHRICRVEQWRGSGFE
jgi:hypothetical protein